MAASNQITPLPSDNGAGVFIVEMYRNQAGVVKLALIMVRAWVYDHHKKKWIRKYTVPGGKRDSGEDIEDTARRECKEETANLFRFSKSAMDDSFAVRHQTFVVYFVMLQGPIMSKYYYQNLKTLTANGADHDYLETDKMIRVYLDDLVMSGVSTTKGDLQTVDANGNAVLIEGRTKAVVREALAAGFIPQLQSQTPNFNPDFKKDPKLMHTKCYWI
jgi:ADP-ribose pyrophosphatase YjhB (NUDIX family)